MRLERVTAEMEQSPAKASLYDDAAVACDRLGKPTEAIAWIEKKKQFAEKEDVAPGQPSTHYKTLANLGTFHAHRWIKASKSGQSPDPKDLQEAIRLVSSAIEEYPQAHFNRERYQLLLLRWLNGEETIFSDMVSSHSWRLRADKILFSYRSPYHISKKPDRQSKCETNPYPFTLPKPSRAAVIPTPIPPSGINGKNLNSLLPHVRRYRSFSA